MSSQERVSCAAQARPADSWSRPRPGGSRRAPGKRRGARDDRAIVPSRV